jgi:predicted CoA-binding protein
VAASDPRRIIGEFLARGPYAVVGASADRAKYGNKVLRCYLQHDLEVYAVNPNCSEVEGQVCHANLRQVPAQVRGVSVITRPEVTEKIVEDAAAAGVEFVWMQPGAESRAAITVAEESGLKVIADGPCVLVALGFRDV